MARRLVLVALLLLITGPVRAATVWRPEPIFTESFCNKELGKARQRFAAALKEAKLARPAPAEPDQALVEPYVDFLRKMDRKAAERAAAQAAAAGAWRGETRYATVTWNRQPYRIGSCQIAKIKIPLNRALEVVGVATPTETDQAIAEKIHSLIKIKMAREACRKLPSYHANVACRKRFHDYQWLDRYPMD